ncbi:MAG: CBS domain-containing protein [Myxococcaceae bacterium]|nr:CBS domain-containing protein [Myxococcaceae bacterium]
MSLERFCRKTVSTALASETVQAAAEKMTQQHVGALIIVDESGRPVGILTDRDIVCRVLSERREPAATPIQAVMSAKPVVARVGDMIEEAAISMRQQGVRRLPIVNASGKAIGMVSLDDLIVLFTAELGQTAAAVRENRGP